MINLLTQLQNTLTTLTILLSSLLGQLTPQIVPQLTPQLPQIASISGNQKLGGIDIVFSDSLPLGGTQQNWWDTNYLNRIKLTLTGVTTSVNLTNFPTLVSLNSSRIDYTKTQNSGQDIRFVDSDDATALSYEIEKWDETATSTVWVKVPDVATSTTDFIYMYYNNASATDSQSSTAVWDSNFMGVWHFGVSSTSQIDSTINNNTGTPGGTEPAKAPNWSATGTIDGNYDYTKANEDYINVPNSNSLNISSDISVGAVIYIHSFDSFAGIVTKDNNGPGYSMRIASDANGSKIAWRLYEDNTHQLYAYVSSSQWVYIIGTYNGTSKNILLYINGIQKATATLSPGTVTSTIALMFGSLSYIPTLGFDGYIDEVRISNTQRSAAWVITDYNSENDSLLTYGAAESAGGTAALTGTAVPTITEADVVAGGKTIILTLTGDTWIAAGAASFDLQRQNIINGLTSAQSETFGWNLVPKVLQGVAGVVRTSDTIVTITLDVFATYNITATETITATIPGTALTLGNQIVASPTFTVTPIAEGVTTAARKRVIIITDD